MKNIFKAILFSNKTSISTSVIFILALIFTTATSINLKKERAINERLHSQIKEMQLLDDRLINIKGTIEFKEKRIGLARTEGIVSALEQILKPLGLRANAIRPLKKEKIEEYTLENAELEIQEIDLNGIVNLLYKIENSPFPLRIKDTFIKTAFENPDHFVLKITISLIRPGATSGTDNNT
jgi:hypothetical protein